jgi:hypothetical protein
MIYCLIGDVGGDKGKEGAKGRMGVSGKAKSPYLYASKLPKNGIQDRKRYDG